VPWLTCGQYLPEHCITQSHLKSGSLLSISWTPDGTQLAAVGGSGSVVFASVVGVAVEDGRVRVEACGDKKLQVSDLLAETQDELDFRDKVVKISLGEACVGMKCITS
jgi:hypothetical protein